MWLWFSSILCTGSWGGGISLNLITNEPSFRMKYFPSTLSLCSYDKTSSLIHHSDNSLRQITSIPKHFFNWQTFYYLPFILKLFSIHFTRRKPRAGRISHKDRPTVKKRHVHGSETKLPCMWTQQASTALCLSQSWIMYFVWISNSTHTHGGETESVRQTERCYRSWLQWHSHQHTHARINALVNSKMLMWAMRERRPGN